MKLLVSTWSNGLFVIDGSAIAHELAGQSVCGLVAADKGEALAIVEGHALRRRLRDGSWEELAKSEASMSTCLTSRGEIYLGANDNARLMCFEGGSLKWMSSFDRVPGRENWYAGTALVDGKVLGPPLGIRTMSAACDGSVLFANVHVGGIPRSTDRGASWHPTIDIESDVHEVVCHPLRPNLVAAAAAIGLCLSRDGGATWQVETEGLHKPHCSAVAFVGDDVFVSASQNPFSKEGAVYRRPVNGAGPLVPVGGGLPRWTKGKVDTAGIAVCGRNAAIVDCGGNVHLSRDTGRTWANVAEVPGGPSAAAFARPPAPG